MPEETDRRARRWTLRERRTRAVRDGGAAGDKAGTE
jgi:hypothetical protein